MTTHHNSAQAPSPPPLAASDHTASAAAPRPTPLDDVLVSIRAATRRGRTWAGVAREVTDVLLTCLPAAELLPRAQEPVSDGVHSRLVHAESDGSFSVVVLTCPPGAATTVHDHVCWGVVTVLEGAEHERRFTLSIDGRVLPREAHVAGPGDVTSFVPPDDIHQVSNRGPGPAVSLHVYGTDVARLGSSTRRVYQSANGPTPDPDHPKEPT